jgi:hypothetical protein
MKMLTQAKQPQVKPLHPSRATPASQATLRPSSGTHTTCSDGPSHCATWSQSTAHCTKCTAYMTRNSSKGSGTVCVNTRYCVNTHPRGRSTRTTPPFPFLESISTHHKWRVLHIIGSCRQPTRPTGKERSRPITKQAAALNTFRMRGRTQVARTGVLEQQADVWRHVGTLCKSCCRYRAPLIPCCALKKT